MVCVAGSKLKQNGHNLWCGFTLINFWLSETSKHEMLHQCWVIVGSPSTTLSQNYATIGCRYAFSVKPLQFLQALIRLWLPRPLMMWSRPLSKQIIQPELVQCWASVYDAGPALNQQWDSVSCLLAYHCSSWWFGSHGVQLWATGTNDSIRRVAESVHI